MPFKDIVGHERRLESLRRSLESGRLHHAYVFFGPEGVGKRSVALALAKSLYCEAAKNDFCDACGECLKVEHGNHPDVRLLAPLPGKKEIAIRQVRELEKEFSLAPFSPKRRKVAIIDPAELMNYPTQNALLKTLEEPPPGTHLVLVSRSLGALLPTILSRCVRQAFGLVPDALIEKLLTERRGFGAQEARKLAALARGRVGVALRSELAELSDERRRWIEKLLAMIEAGDFRAVTALAEELAAEKERASEILEWWESWYRDVLLCQTGASSGLTHVDMREAAEARARRSSIESSLVALFELASMRADVRKNFNRRLLWEHFLLRVAPAFSAPGVL